MRIGKSIALTLAFLLAGASAREAAAGVVVTVDGNTAHAEISLTDGSGATYDADVTITFGTVLNLSATSLGLTAQLVNPNDPIVTSRIPLGMSIDPAFPMMITIEPPVLDWLFTSGFQTGEDGTGILGFTNTYDVEVHTHDLSYVDDSAYRLIKAPVGGAFADYTEDIFPGSIRARGRDGAFSQFMVAKDSATTFVPLLLVALNKLVALQLRVVAAALNDTLSLDLLGLLADITADLSVLINLTGAIDALDSFIAEVLAHAGTDIPNVWTADHSVTNDAGEILGLAQSLRFTLVRMLTAPIL
jgi:hypothetical protein